jgi:hypothetical protein
MRRTMFALCLVFAAAMSQACSHSGSSAPDAPNVPNGRTLTAFQPYLTRTLTPAIARAQFGAPDVETGSGLRIYKYRLDAGRTLWLWFPGDDPIVGARLEATDGTFTDLTLP